MCLQRIQGGKRKENGYGGMQLKMVINCVKAKASPDGNLTSSLVLWSGTVVPCWDVLRGGPTAQDLLRVNSVQSPHPWCSTLAHQVRCIGTCTAWLVGGKSSAPWRYRQGPPVLSKKDISLSLPIWYHSQENRVKGSFSPWIWLP